MSLPVGEMRLTHGGGASIHLGRRTRRTDRRTAASDRRCSRRESLVYPTVPAKPSVRPTRRSSEETRTCVGETRLSAGQVSPRDRRARGSRGMAGRFRDAGARDEANHGRPPRDPRGAPPVQVWSRRKDLGREQGRQGQRVEGWRTTRPMPLSISTHPLASLASWRFRSLVDRHQLDVEEEPRVGRDFRRASCGAVAEVGGDP
jgi:hypothetical protein